MIRDNRYGTKIWPLLAPLAVLHVLATGAAGGCTETSESLQRSPEDHQQDLEPADATGDEDEGFVHEAAQVSLPQLPQPPWRIIFAAPTDSSVEADIAYLTKGQPYNEAASVEATDPTSQIVLKYLGKGQPVYGNPEELAQPAEPSTPPQSKGFQVWAGANIETRNRFEILIPDDYLSQFSGIETWVDDSAAQGAPDPASPELASSASSQTVAADGSAAILTGHEETQEPPSLPAWSNNYDSRSQIYATNGAVGGVNRWLVQLGAGCSAIMVGARHIITAAHCVTPGAGGGTTWFLDDITASRGRNGTSVEDQILIDDDNIPPGEVAWWWTDAGWTRSGDGAEDFAIITLPGSFGCVSFNGQCNWAYGYLSDTTVGAKSPVERGYPLCDAVLWTGNDRIDEPCQDTQQTPTSCQYYGWWSCSTPCRPDHVYGGPASSFGTFGNSKDGYNRTVSYGNDVSAGDSGAPIYFQHWGYWFVAAVHYYSDCGKACTVGEDCNGVQHPAFGTRLTPTRADMITWFIQNWPNY